MASDIQQLRITRLELRNWRNFQRVDLELQPRAFLVGPNASGKSNLLDAIRFLHDVVSVGGGFEDAVADRGGVSSLRCLAARRQPDIEIAIELGTEVSQAAWRYELSFGQTPQRRPVLRKERVRQGGSWLLDRPDSADADDPERLSQTVLEQVHANQQFRAIAEFLREVRYRHIVPQLIREPDRSVGRYDDPYGGDFLDQIAGTQKRTRDARLRKIGQALQVAVPQLKELELDRDEYGVNHLRGRYEHWRRQGAWQSESDFSDGTLRLLGLLWTVLDGYGPLLLEEPELSLHPAVVRFIPAMLARMQSHSKRQVLLSTQSSEMLHDPGIGLDEVFLLVPGAEGTDIRSAASFAEVPRLLEEGLTMGEAVLPKTQPAQADQLSLFPAA